MDGTRRKSREARQLAVGLLLVEEVCVFIHSPYKSIELIYMTSAFVVVLVWCLEEVASMHKRDGAQLTEEIPHLQRIDCPVEES